MSNRKGYVKFKYDKELNRRLIRVSKLHPEIKNDKYVYDYENNELGKIENGKFTPASSIVIWDLGRCYQFNNKGLAELYPTKWLLDYLKDAAVKYLNKTSDDTDLIILN